MPRKDAPAIEREFKLRIPSAQAEARLLASLGPAPANGARQTNHFFDTAARALRGARLALRLREEESAFTLALKGPLQGQGPDASGALAARPEEELRVSADEARALLAGHRSPLALLEASALAAAPLVREARARAGTAPLLHLGAFENERRRVGPLAFPRGGPSLVFEFDTTHFPGGVIERELEVELPPDAPVAAIERELRALFTAGAVPFEPARSKAERFFALLERE